MSRIKMISSSCNNKQLDTFGETKVPKPYNQMYSSLDHSTKGFVHAQYVSI